MAKHKQTIVILALKGAEATKPKILAKSSNTLLFLQ